MDEKARNKTTKTIIFVSRLVAFLVLRRGSRLIGNLGLIKFVAHGGVCLVQSDI